jgi:hypothetical protein
MHPDDQDTRDRPLVRPRWVWGGLLLALIGAGTLGLGVALLSWPPSILGAGLLLLGAGASLRGGVLYDAVPTLGVRRELQQVRDGSVHEGVAPGDTVATPASRRDAAAADRSARARTESARHPSDVHWAPAAGWLLLLVATVLTVSQWELVAPTATGRANSARDTALAIVLGLGGMRLALSAGRHLIVGSITGLAGAALVLAGFLADHDHAGLALVEVVGGGLAVLCSLTAIASPSPTRSR